MRPLLLTRLALALLLSVGMATFAQNQHVLDGVVVTVNGSPVLLSDWEEAIHYEAFLQGRPISSFSDAERSETLNRLIDRELIAQQMQGDYTPEESEVNEQVKKVRAQLEGSESASGWDNLLRSYGLTEDEFVRATRRQVEILRFIELRLRPSVRVTQEEIQQYYSEKLVPQLQQKGVTPEPLEKLRPRIREVLVQEKMQPVLEAWVANLRTQSVIHYTSLNSPPDSNKSTSGQLK